MLGRLHKVNWGLPGIPKGIFLSSTLGVGGEGQGAVRQIFVDLG